MQNNLSVKQLDKNKARIRADQTNSIWSTIKMPFLDSDDSFACGLVRPHSCKNENKLKESSCGQLSALTYSVSKKDGVRALASERWSQESGD